jgi:hypothetical protein
MHYPFWSTPYNLQDDTMITPKYKLITMRYMHFCTLYCASTFALFYAFYCTNTVLLFLWKTHMVYCHTVIHKSIVTVINSCVHYLLKYVSLMCTFTQLSTNALTEGCIYCFNFLLVHS